MNIDTIAEGNWRSDIAGMEVSGLLNDRIITRKIQGINISELPALVEYVRFHTSVLNKDVPEKCFSVTDPMVNGIVQPGVWRGVSVKAVEGVHNPGRTTSPAGTIVQVLAWGWAGALIDTEARLTGGDNQPLQPERTLERKYVNLDYTMVGKMIDDIETTKYVADPTIEGKKYTGRYRILSSAPSRASDGSGIITQTLAKNLVISPEVLPTPILISNNDALLSPFALDTTSVKNSHVYEYRWIDPSYAKTLCDTVALTTGVIDAKVVHVNDGSDSIQILTETNTWTGNLSQFWEHRVQSPTFAAESIIDTFSHIPLDSLASLSVLRTTLNTPATGYKVSSLVDVTAEEGFGRLVRTQDKLFPSPVTSANGVRTDEDILLLMVAGVIRTTVWKAVKDSDLDAAMTTLLTDPTGYTALRVGNNYSGTGSCDITRTMLTRGKITDKIQTSIEYPTFEGERITYHYPGLNLVDAKAMEVTLLATPIVGYKIDSLSIVESRMALTVVQQISKVQIAPFTLSAVHQQSFVHSFGLVTMATTVYLNIPKASIGTVKTAINALTGIIVLDISDDDRGTGSANITFTWRTKPTGPVALGAIQQAGPSKFHWPTQNRLWIDINLTDKDALATAVALAMAGTAPYAPAAFDVIQDASGSDAGDKTGHISQKISKKPATYTPALFSEQQSLNPHGLQSAILTTDTMEYPQIAYADLASTFAILQTFLGTPPKGRIQVSMNGNETFAMRGFKEATPTWANTTGVSVKVGIQNPGAIGESKTELATGVPVALAEALVAAAVPDTDYALDEVGMTERGEGEAAIHKRQTLKSETAIIVRIIPACGSQRAAQGRIWPLVLTANVDAVMAAALTEGVDATHILKYTEKRNLGGGMWHVSSMTESPQVVVTSFTAAYGDESISVVEEGQDADVIPVISDASPIIAESVSVRLNALGKYDYGKHSVTARIPKSFPPAGITWTNYGDTYTQNVYTFDAPTGKSWLHYVHHRQVVRNHFIRFFLTAAEAVAAANGAESSSPSQAGGGLWVAHWTVRGDGDLSVDTLTKPF